MGASHFIAASKPLKEALKSANLLKSLKFNTLISGERGTGRHTLARLMMPEAPIVHADDESLFAKIEKQSQLIVDRFERLEHPHRFFQAVRKAGAQVVAVAESGAAEEKSFFSVKIELPPLSERPEDIPPLVEKFKRETLAMFGDEGDFEIDTGHLDVSQNAFSLRRGVVMQYLSQRFDEEEILRINERFLLRHMGGEDDFYRRMLYLYEVPLIRAGMRVYKSQLKMSQAFGLNRNTLRKKINDWKAKLIPPKNDLNEE